jgi:hypothetical protein
MMTIISDFFRSGADCSSNRLATEADHLRAEGIIEPHLFRGLFVRRKAVPCR